MRSINFFKRYRDLLVVAMLLILPFVFYASNAKSPQEYNFFDRGVLMVSAPMQWVVVTTLDHISAVWQHYIALVGVQEENDHLKQENAQLRSELATHEEQRHENERLRLLLGLQKVAPDVKMIFAEVVATSPSPLFRSIRINRGKRDDVEVGDAVINHEGVVGRVAAVGDHYADVMLLIDSNSSTDVLVQHTRTRARVRGQGGDGSLGLDVQYLTRTADIEPNNILVTSGLGYSFPKGLPVGKVVSVERRAFGLYQRAVVQPSVNFNKLEVVMVILKNYPAEASFELPDADTSNDNQEAEGAMENLIQIDTPALQPYHPSEP